MPVTCYQIADYGQESEQSVLLVNTYSLTADQTDLEDLLRLVAPSVRALGPTSSMFNPDYRYGVARAEFPDALALLDSHQAPRVTAITQCSLSVCLDFYQHPAASDDGSDSTVVWTKTELGALVHAAKYGGALRDAGPALASRVTDFVSRHPVLGKAVGVAPTPSSQSLGAAERGLVGGLARWLARELDIPIVRLERISITPHPQKSLPREEDPDANQANSMHAVIDRDGLVLIIDDLMRDASTVNEAARALSEAGASAVASLTLAKEYTGTQHYQFS